LNFQIKRRGQTYKYTTKWHLVKSSHKCKLHILRNIVNHFSYKQTLQLVEAFNSNICMHINLQSLSGFIKHLHANKPRIIKAFYQSICMQINLQSLRHLIKHFTWKLTYIHWGILSNNFHANKPTTIEAFNQTFCMQINLQLLKHFIKQSSYK